MGGDRLPGPFVKKPFLSASLSSNPGFVTPGKSLNISESLL